MMATNEHTIIPACHQHSSSRPRHDSGRANCMVVCSWPYLRFDLGGGVGGLRGVLERGCVSGARRVCDAAGRGVTMGWRIALETRRGGGSETRRRSRGDGLAASVGDAAGHGGSETRRRSVEMVWRIALRGAEVPWRWVGGFRCAGRRFDSGARGGSVARRGAGVSEVWAGSCRILPS